MKKISFVFLQWSLLLCAIAVLAIGSVKLVSHIFWSVKVSEPFTYTAPLPPDNEPFDLDRSQSVAFQLATEWDKDAKVTLIGWLTTCITAQSTDRKEIVIDFVSTKFHFLQFRRFAQTIDIQPMNGLAEIVVRKLPNMKWEPRLFDLDELQSLSVDFDTALATVRKHGGADYEREHSPCYVRVRFQGGNWHFVYSSDEYGVFDLMELRVDGTTGEIVR